MSTNSARKSPFCTCTHVSGGHVSSCALYVPAFSGVLPVWAKRQWYEIHFRSAKDPTVARLDSRRRSLKSATRIRDELLVTDNYVDVWLSEVNRL